MNNPYLDIRRDRPPPIWWDEHAVPRYCLFRPTEVANTYATGCALLLIECQGCGEQFMVAASASDYRELEDAIRLRELGWGDPPNVDCCAAGPTMTSVPKRVLSFWRKPAPSFGWERVPELEVEITPSWWERETE